MRMTVYLLSGPTERVIEMLKPWFGYRAVILYRKRPNHPHDSFPERPRVRTTSFRREAAYPDLSAVMSLEVSGSTGVRAWPDVICH